MTLSNGKDRINSLIEFCLHLLLLALLILTATVNSTRTHATKNVNPLFRQSSQNRHNRADQVATHVGSSNNHYLDNFLPLSRVESKLKNRTPSTFAIENKKIQDIDYIGYRLSNPDIAIDDTNTTLLVHSTNDDHTAGQGGSGAEKKHYWALVLLFFPIATLFGNSLVVLSVIREKNLKTVTNYFVVSLAVADMTVAAAVMPIAVYYEVFNIKKTSL
jgi:hypothetical protein